MMGLMVALLCGTWVWADEDVQAEPEAPRPPAPEMVKAAYLGVATKPVSETLVHHLDLPAGTGIVVDFVDPESPAAETIHKHDILYKLNDQILVNHSQLAVLVRIHKPGEKITLTILRKGKKQELSVQLAEKEVPKLTRRPWHMPRIDFGHPRMQRWIPHFDPGRVEDMKGKVKEMLDQWGMAPEKIGEMMEKLHEDIEANGSIHLRLKPGPAAPGTQINIRTEGSTKSVITTTDSRRSFTLTTTHDGHKHLTVSDHTGEVLFDGPVNNAEETAKIPADLKKGFDKVTSMAKDMGGKIRPGKDVL